MKKRILSFLTAAIMTAALLTACGAEKETPQLTPTENGAQTEAADETQSAAAAPDAGSTGADTDADAETENPQAPADTSAADAELTNDSIGPVSFTPNENGYSMVYGGNTLHAYFKRTNVVAGSGKMTIKNMADDSVVEEIDLKDTKKCIVGEQDSTFSLLGWDGGTHLIIRLENTPASGESYYVNLEEGAFTSADGTIRSKAVSDSETWRYGVAPYGVIPALPSGSSVYVGDVLSADLLIRQPAAYAKIENYDENRVRFNEKEFEKDGKLEIKIYQIGDDSFTVTFYNDDDDPIGSITLSYTASMPPEPEEEAPRKSVTNL